MVGGLCVESDKCRSLVSAKGLCPVNQDRGVECCFERESSGIFPFAFPLFNVSPFFQLSRSSCLVSSRILAEQSAAVASIIGPILSFSLFFNQLFAFNKIISL